MLTTTLLGTVGPRDTGELEAISAEHTVRRTRRYGLLLDSASLATCIICRVLWLTLDIAERGGGLYHFFPKFAPFFFVPLITFFPLSSVQIIIIPACCLLCVLEDDM